MTPEVATKVRPLIEDKKSWDGLLVAIDAHLDDLRRANDTADTATVTKNQGGILALTRLQHLRDEVKGALK